MTFDFYLKCFFGLGIGTMVMVMVMVMVFLRDFLTAKNGKGSPHADLNVADSVDLFHPLEENFFDEEGPWRASQRNDELIQMNTDFEKECLNIANHSTFMP